MELAALKFTAIVLGAWRLDRAYRVAWDVVSDYLNSLSYDKDTLPLLRQEVQLEITVFEEVENLQPAEAPTFEERLASFTRDISKLLEVRDILAHVLKLALWAEYYGLLSFNTEGGRFEPKDEGQNTLSLSELRT